MPVVIFFHALILNKIPHFWMDTNLVFYCINMRSREIYLLNPWMLVEWIIFF